MFRRLKLPKSNFNSFLHTLSPRSIITRHSSAACVATVTNSFHFPVVHENLAQISVNSAPFPKSGQTKAKTRRKLFHSEPDLGKTKIYEISDLHLEYYNDPMILYSNISKILPSADILLLAGDIGYPMDRHADDYLFLLDKFKQKYNEVILVPGNHEYFQTKNFDRDQIRENLGNICKKTACHFLDNQTIELNGVQFIGTTLWTKIDPWIKHLINGKGKTFGTIFEDFESYQGEFNKSFQFLQNQLMRDHEKKIIVTHHVPSYKLQHPKYKENYMYNSMFYSEILDSLNLTNVKYWFCGHTHESGSMIHSHSGTQVILNPYGTPWEQSKRQTEISTKVYLI
jgi:predicted phosphohydrolase